MKPQTECRDIVTPPKRRIVPAAGLQGVRKLCFSYFSKETKYLDVYCNHKALNPNDCVAQDLLNRVFNLPALSVAAQKHQSSYFIVSCISVPPSVPRLLLLPISLFLSYGRLLKMLSDNLSFLILSECYIYFSHCIFVSSLLTKKSRWNQI
jgi:hypothetical protein